MASIKDLDGIKEKDEQGYEVQVYWRDNALWLSEAGGTPVTFTVYGSESPTYLKRRSETYRELAKTEVQPDSQTLAAFIAACAVKGWSGIEEPCTPENARALMAFEFLRMQVENVSARGKGFFAAASPDSASG